MRMPALLPALTAAFVLAACDARADRIATEPGLAAAAEQAHDDIDCGLFRERAHEDPEMLVREYARYDAMGHFLTPSAWFEGAVLCPGHTRFEEAITVIARYYVEPLHVTADSALLTVHYDRLGELVPAPGDSLAFVADERTVTHTFTLVPTQWGWRIVRLPRQRHVASATTEGLPVRAQPNSPRSEP
jgi:hypothetical protein